MQEQDINEPAYVAAIQEIIAKINQAMESGDYGALSDGAKHLNDFLNVPPMARWEFEVGGDGELRKVVVAAPTRAIATLQAVTDVYDAEGLSEDEVYLHAVLVGRLQ